MTQLELAINYLEQHEADMIALWENIVRLESPSADTAAVTKLGEYLADYCASRPFPSIASPYVTKPSRLVQKKWVQASLSAVQTTVRARLVSMRHSHRSISA